MNYDLPAYVLDTHTLVWYLSNFKKLGKQAQEVFDTIEKGDAIALIPAIVLAERKRIQVTLEDTLAKIESADNFKIIFMDLVVIRKLVELKGIPELHDRIIVATTLTNNSILITKDKQVTKSGVVQTLWQ